MEAVTVERSTPTLTARRSLRLGLLLGALIGFGTPAVTQAEPYLALREGMRCSACHTNMNGGGKRTDLVSTHAREILRYPGFLGSFANPPEFFSGELNRFLGVGADLRTSAALIFQELGQDGWVRNDRIFRSRLDQTRFELNQATIYGEIRLIPDRLSVYVDQRLAPSIDTREAFAMVKGLPWNGYVKAGQFFLPYGLQLQDDESFIRGGRRTGSANTGFSFNVREVGGAVGFEPGPFTFMLAVTDGSPGDRDVRVTGTAYTLFDELPIVRSLMLGTSFSRVGPPGTETIVWGFFAGKTIQRLTLLAEVDFRSDRLRETGRQRIGQFLSYVEANYLFFDWLNFKVAFDYADSDGRITRQEGGQTVLDTANDAENRFSIGFEPFLTRYIQPRIFYRINNGVRSLPTHNQNILFAEAHVFF